MTGDPTHDHPDYGHIRGMAQYATEHFEEETEVDDAAVDPAIDVDSNELKVPAGQVCARCGQAIGAESYVRRTASGAYEHEMCPVHVDVSGD
jgi:hypothetical protein